MERMGLQRHTINGTDYHVLRLVRSSALLSLHRKGALALGTFDGVFRLAPNTFITPDGLTMDGQRILDFTHNRGYLRWNDSTGLLQIQGLPCTTVVGPWHCRFCFSMTNGFMCTTQGGDTVLEFHGQRIVWYAKEHQILIGDVPYEILRRIPRDSVVSHLPVFYTKHKIQVDAPCSNTFPVLDAQQELRKDRLFVTVYHAPFTCFSAAERTNSQTSLTETTTLLAQDTCTPFKDDTAPLRTLLGLADTNGYFSIPPIKCTELGEEAIRVLVSDNPDCTLPIEYRLRTGCYVMNRVKLHCTTTV